MTEAEKDLRLGDMLTIDLVLCKIRVGDRNKAIESIGELMYSAGKIKKQYIGAMKRVIDELGAYVVIAPGIALLHARPEDGVIEPCLALMTLSVPINFGHPDNDPVDLVFGLAALDDKMHVLALTSLAKRLATYGIIEKIRESQDRKELMRVILGS